MTTTEIVVSTPRQALAPIMPPEQFIESHKILTDMIGKILVENEDYGVIPGTRGNPVLLKPGAERLCKAYGLTSQYEVVSTEIDHERVNSYTKEYRDRGRLIREDQTSIGLYRYVVRCKLSNGEGRVYGDALASCSSSESKYISRPRDSENTVLKMACKRSLVAAVLNAFGLSNRFTQDMEDHVVDAKVEQPASGADERRAPPPAAEKRAVGFDPQNPAHVEWLTRELARREMIVDDEVGLVDRLRGRPSSDLETVLREMGLIQDTTATGESPAS